MKRVPWRDEIEKLRFYLQILARLPHYCVASAASFTSLMHAGARSLDARDRNCLTVLYLLRSIILSSAPVLLTHDQMDKGVAERDWSRRKEHRQKVEQRHGMRKGKVLVRTLCHHWLIRNRQGT